MSDEIVLYDLGRRGTDSCWSYNIWKTRMALNYKGLPYTTVWLDHSNVGSTLKAIGAPPNTTGQGPEYTVPTIKAPDGSVVSDSAIIAAKLEALYPSPPLHLDPDLQSKADQAVHMTAVPLFAIFMPLVARNVVKENTVAAYITPRLRGVGMSLEELKEKRGGEVAWKAAEPGLNALKALLTEHKRDQGPFILGSQVCYADFVVVATLESFKRVDSDMFERAIAWDEAFAQIHDASKDWLKNDQ